MSDSDSPNDNSGRAHADLLAQQAAFFESYFKKGAQFTRDLMEETQRLRTRLAELEERLDDAEKGAEFEARYQQIERENNDLAALYVAQSQLHSSLDSREVLEVITEVLLNFVGVDSFAILLTNAEGQLQSVCEVGSDHLAGSASVRNRALTQLMGQGGMHCEGVSKSDTASVPIGLLTLEHLGRPFGAIAMWGFLKQKAELTSLDRQIFDLLVSSGAMALEASRVVGEARLGLPMDSNEGSYERFQRLL